MDKKVKLFQNNQKDNTLFFENYYINNEIKFTTLCFFIRQDILIAYEFVDNIFSFKEIAKKFLEKQKPNGFVDFYYIHLTNKNIITEAKDILINLPISKDEIKNVALFYYDLETDHVKEIIPAIRNDNYLYDNYIKPTEARKLKSIKSASNEFIDASNEKVSFDNTNPDLSINDSPFKLDLENKLDDFVSNLDTKNLINYNQDIDNTFYENEINDNDFLIDDTSLIESIEDYSNQLNLTQKLLDDFDFNPNLSTTFLEEKNDISNFDNLNDDQYNNEIHSSLLKKSDYFRKLDEITKNLKNDDLLANTQDIFNHLSKKINKE